MKGKQARSTQSDNADNDAKAIIELFEAGDRALIAADIAEMERIYSDDYLQYDERGNRFTRQNIIDHLKTGTLRFVSMTSTGKRVRVLSKTFAVVHGSEEDVLERNGKRAALRYIYTDVVMKRAGKWRIVASQLARQT